MNAGTNYPKTLVEAVRYFSDPAVTLAFFVKLRWPNGVACPHCGSTNVHFLAAQSRWKCSENHPRRQFTVKIGTIMEESPMTLDKWAVAFWLEVNAKNSISSYELHRALGITQKSAWFMLHRIRLATESGGLEKLGGAGSNGVEADETYIGGKAEFMHAKRRKKIVTGTGAFGSGKTAVMGLLERHGPKGKSKVRTAVIPDTKRTTIHDVIHKNVAPGTELYTDSAHGYRGLPPEFVHAFIDHAEKYVEGKVHTNGLENFWSLFKRCIKGTHICVEPFHLKAYLDSECFRFNNREFNDGERFVLAMAGMEGKRLTYKVLIGADDDSEGALNASGEASAGLAN
jgi:transposase-like protein